MMHHRFLRTLLPLLLSGLSGCIFSTHERVAGGAEDFPNTVALGAAVSGHISDQAEWDQFSVIPSTLPSFQDADSLVVAPDTSSPVKALGKTLGKSAAGAGHAGLGNKKDTVTWDLSDTATLGVARRIHVLEGLLKVHGDTTVFRYDDKAKDTIAGNELVLLSKGADLYLSGRVQAYRYENLDSAGGFDRAFFFDRIPLAGAGIRNSLLIILPGPDGDIATKADNRPAYYGFTVTRPASDGSGTLDTTESFEIADADGDGALWGAGDSGLVDFKQKRPNPAGRPTVEVIVQKMRAVLFKDEQKTYPISFTEARTDKDGKKAVFSVKGVRADSAFGPGDTAWISVHVTYPADAKLLEKHSRYKVLLGGQPKHYQDNKLLLYTLEARWRKDSLTVTRLTFKPDQPLVSTILATAGDLNVDVDFSDGGTGVAVGRLEDNHIDVDLTRKPREGKIRRFHIRWGKAGNVISQTHLD